MNNLFAKIADRIGTFQERAISALAGVHTDLGDNVTSLNISKVERKLIEDLKELRDKGGDRPFFRALLAQATPLEPISSTNWNEAQKRIFIDLFALYQSLLESQEADIYTGELTREKFLQTKAAILKVINEVRLYQFLRANPDYQDAKFVNFQAALNETDERPAAAVDQAVRLLELAPRTKAVRSLANYDLKTTRVTTETIGADPAGLEKEFGPERMLDANPESFWVESATADGPILQTYAPSGDAGLGTQIDVEGVICHVYLDLSHAALANGVRVLPFGEFPVTIIDLAFKESAAQQVWQKIPNFEVEDATLDWIEVNFEPRTIAKLRVTLLQKNYRLNIYHLPEKLVRNGLLWQQLSQTSADNTVSQLSLSPRQEDDVLLNPAELSTLQAVDDFNTTLNQVELPLGRERQFDLGSAQVRAAAQSLSKISPSLADEILFRIDGEKETAVNKLLSIRKYEYIYGIRSVELSYTVYQPVGHYSTQKFASGATVLEVSLTTEERHPKFSDGLGEYFKTSTEWEVEIGDNRRFAIAPRNWAIDGELVVPDEYLHFDRNSRSAITRLPIADTATVLRRNGERVPLSDYSIGILEVENPYIVEDVEPALRSRHAEPVATQIGRGIVTITNQDSFDPNAAYTLQYVAKDGSDVIELDGIMNSTALVEPEVFTETNREHAIVLSRIPYIDYNIVNSEDWVRDDVLDARWKFVPTETNYKTGLVNVTGDSAEVLGSGTGWLTGLDVSTDHALRILGDDSVYKISSIDSATELTLAETFKGTPDTGAEYVIGQYFESDGYIYAFDNIVYEPIRVYVNDVKAYNLTDYEALEHQAFTEKPSSGRQYQFIHAGNILYFNAPIANAKIEVYYSWLTEYIRVNSVLRCNIPVGTVLTPQVNSARVELKTSKL